MEMRRLGKTGLSVAPIVIGGNVFGWTADEKTSFAILDAFFDAGLNAIDTADVYSAWVPGNKGGDSEEIIGRWLKQSAVSRDKAVIITKVGSDMGQGKTLKAGYILKAVEASLSRLQTDYIDLYLSHWPDADTPHEETLGAFAKLKQQGKIRAIGCSNYDATLLQASFDAAEKAALPRYDVLQPEYNLCERASFEGPLAELCVEEDLGVITYFSLA
ncbi:aldo/keto reductase, partial [Rhizobium phaseoli]